MHPPTDQYSLKPEKGKSITNNMRIASGTQINKLLDDKKRSSDIPFEVNSEESKDAFNVGLIKGLSC